MEMDIRQRTFDARSKASIMKLALARNAVGCLVRIEESRGTEEAHDSYRERQQEPKLVDQVTCTFGAGSNDHEARTGEECCGLLGTCRRI